MKSRYYFGASRAKCRPDAGPIPPWNGYKTASGSLLEIPTSLEWLQNSLLQAPTPLTGARMFQGRNLFQDPDFHEPFATAFISEWFTFIVTPGTVNLHLKGLSIRNGFGITPQGPHGPLGPLGPLLGPLALCPGKVGVTSLESRKQGAYMRVGGHARSVMNS